jgi:hypothetical protein
MWVSENQAGRASVWCVGGPDLPDAAAVIHSCRYLPAAGGLDLAVLEPGAFAPEGLKLVTAVLTGDDVPDLPVRMLLTDPEGTRDLMVERPPGVPGILFAWGFTSGDRRDLRVLDANGREVAACPACAPGR